MLCTSNFQEAQAAQSLYYTTEIQIQQLPTRLAAKEKLTCMLRKVVSDHFIINGTIMYNKQKPARAVSVTTGRNKTKTDEPGNVNLLSKDGVQIVLT